MTSHASILTKTWVVVFDGGRASAFENEGFDDAPNLKFVFGSENDNPHSHEQGEDKAGRFGAPRGGAAVAKGGGASASGPSPKGAHGGRSAVSSSDPHDKREARFVDGFLAELEAAARAKRFDRLVAIAPAPLLNRLRDAAPGAAAKLAASHAGDLAHAPVAKIERAFQDALLK
jgi:protein required for attachment to host cells